ncbi:MAG: TlpA family protein disulfide reductase [Deltaproteobacteria bacterium]|nr:TlpA family protein disulfide reductase [Deltaproteobacteria bacterium]
MRILLSPVLLAAFLGFAHGSRAEPPTPLPLPPAPAPIATTPVTGQDYRTKVVAPHAGRVLLVSLWATYCLPCIEELPGLMKLKKKLANKGADVVFVNADGPGAPAGLLSGVLQRRSIVLEHTFVVDVEDPAPFLAAVDPTWSGEVPFHAVYGRDGRRLAGLSGARPLAEIEQAVVAALAAAPVPAPAPAASTAVTPP